MTMVIVIVKQIGQSTNQYPNILYEYRSVIGDFLQYQHHTDITESIQMMDL